MNQRPLYVSALVLVIVGAINWLLVGLFHFDLVARIAGQRFGDVGTLNGIIYILVGLAGLYLAIATWLVPQVGHERKSPTRILPR
ncbi:MAG TPA: DUF378 domain-containing protein [Planctomycetota bacterium]|nr:DUF378 domain-containing protein [Planctomycetota bacterium]